MKRHTNQIEKICFGFVLRFTTTHVLTYLVFGIL
jgi:hypothetical protein